MSKYTIQATAACCGAVGTLADLEVHDCAVQENGGRCEDYPCCGHTDGLGCQTTAAMTGEYWSEGPGAVHLLCDHEAGHYPCWDDEDDD